MRDATTYYGGVVDLYQVHNLSMTREVLDLFRHAREVGHVRAVGVTHYRPEAMPDVLAWMEKMEGPPPGMPIGGTTPMAHGEENIITLDLSAGEYALICFVPDAKDGKPHVVHGMATEITIVAK